MPELVVLRGIEKLPDLTEAEVYYVTADGIHPSIHVVTVAPPSV